jgi:SAM-dependent methyltransferase
MTRAWVAAPCDLCRASEARTILTVPHADAPGGRSTIVQCAVCGLRRLDPRPGPDDIASYYEGDYYAHAGRTRGAAKQWLWDMMRDISSRARGRGRRLAILRPVIAPLAQYAFDINVPLDGNGVRRVLDVGCGHGDILMYLKSRGCEVQGVELDARAAQKGREQGVPIHVGELEELRLPADSIDAVIMCHSLEHVPNPTQLLRESARVLGPGGTLHIAVPNGASTGLRIEGGAWWALMHPVHFWYFDAGTLGRLLEGAGFDVLTTRFRNHHVRERVLRVARDAARPALSTGRAARFAWVLLREGGGGDILRVVARRRMTTEESRRSRERGGLGRLGATVAPEDHA